ncbi:MAG: type I restriction endonuclease subunit S, partial [Gammaproteobacteria bacterium]|nr:type I restriction endonuclease subunit S [Gammaproteobacteria bacterium]
MPPTWQVCRLGDVFDYGAARKAEPIEIPPSAWVLELEDIEKDTSKVLQRITFAERRSKSTKNCFSAGDILYGKLRPYLNKVVLADEDGFCTTEIVPLSSSPWVDNRYLFHWLKHPAFLDYVSAVSHGLNMPRLGTEAGRAAPLVIAPYAEQKRIADKLDAVLARVDACRERLDRVPAIIKRFRQSVLAAATSGALTEDWRGENPLPDGCSEREVAEYLELRGRRQGTQRKFKDPVAPDLTNWHLDAPASWSVQSISAYAECLDHLRVPVTRSERSKAKGLYPYYGANGQVDIVDEYIFDDDLVLVTEDETFYGREKPIAYRVSGRCWVNNHAHVLLAGDSDRADYLCFCLMYYNVLPWLTGTTGRAKLTQGVLNTLPIAVPPQKEIVEIVRRVENLFAYADRLEARYKTAREQVERLTPALLAKAFRGELVTQDPNDEPASVLLERLRGHRVETPPDRRRR